jgi:GntR family transcriptional regulator/MocR family aminotransferase
MPEDAPPAVAAAFRVSLPALDHFPRRAWSRLISRHARIASIRDMAYGDPMGEPAFRAAIAEYLGSVRAVRCDPSQIMVTSGSQQAVQITLHALLDGGDPVWVEEPGYPGTHRALVGSGCEPVPVPVDDEGLDVEEGTRRRPSARAAYVTPSHQYPLGMTLSAGRRIQLLNWAQRADAWIIEDDYDSEYRFGAEPITSLQGLDTDDRVIYIGTFSKVLFPALRMGYLVLPKDLIATFRVVRDAVDIFPPVLYQRALTDFIRDGGFARHIRRMRTLYAVRRQRMITALERSCRGWPAPGRTAAEEHRRHISRCQGRCSGNRLHPAFGLLSGIAAARRFDPGLRWCGCRAHRRCGPQARQTRSQNEDLSLSAWTKSGRRSGAGEQHGRLAVGRFAPSGQVADLACQVN